MIEAFNLGPFLIPTRPLLLLLCLILAIWIAGRLARRFGLNINQVKRTAEHTAWSGVVGARLVFALVHFSAYSYAPWTILYFWQPGYMYLGGLLFGGACMNEVRYGADFLPVVCRRSQTGLWRNHSRAARRPAFYRPASAYRRGGRRNALELPGFHDHPKGGAGTGGGLHHRAETG